MNCVEMLEEGKKAAERYEMGVGPADHQRMTAIMYALLSLAESNALVASLIQETHSYQIVWWKTLVEMAKEKHDAGKAG